MANVVTRGQANLLGQVNFGLVAYRDNVAAAPGLDYLVRTYVDLNEGRDAEGFLSRLKTMRDASVWMQSFGQFEALDLDAFETFLERELKD